ncbi:MAG TPA: S41 family peptidase [Candidatus Paceibacterota bacterium]|nr:S41 family peptidase [Candidatus Paceibacterota bacterium]
MKTYLKAFAFLALILIGPCILQGFHAASRTAYASVTNPQSAQSNTALDSIGVEWSNIFSLIDAYYIDPVDHYACFQKTQAEGLSACLDPWSEYFSAKQWKEFNEVVSGNYAGVGMVLEPDADRLKLFPFPGEPAARAGIIANDVLLSVGTTKVTQARNYSESDVKRVVDLIRGNAGTAIAVTVLRGGSVIGPISITREHVTAPSVTYQEVKPLAGSASSPNAGYVKISFFGPSTAAEFQTALTNLTKNGKINRFFIFDLRGDGGGEVNAALSMLEMLAPADGSLMLTEKFKDHSKEKVAAKKGAFGDAHGVILVDGFTASASEMFSGTLQDWGKFKLVGEHTYGKGVAQTSFPLQWPPSADSPWLKLTVLHYLVGNGRKPIVLGKGLIPDYNVSGVLSPAEIKQLQKDMKTQDPTKPYLDPAVDKQLEKALELSTH